MQVAQKAADKAKKEDAEAAATEAKKESDTSKVTLFAEASNKAGLTGCKPSSSLEADQHPRVFVETKTADLSVSTSDHQTECILGHVHLCPGSSPGQHQCLA